MEYAKSQQTYAEYISGVTERGSKPWKIAPSAGLQFGEDKYTWDQIKKAVKIKSRKYKKVEYNWDDLIWNVCIGTAEIEDTDGFYGVETIDGYQASWTVFENHVDSQQFIMTDERREIIQNIRSMEAPRADQEEPSNDVEIEVTELDMYGDIGDLALDDPDS